MAQLITHHLLLLLVLITCFSKPYGQNRNVTVYEIVGNDSVQIEILAYDLWTTSAERLGNVVAVAVSIAVIAQ